MSEHDFNRTAIPNRQRLPARALGGRFVLAGVVERLFGRPPGRRMPEPPKRSFSTEFAAQTFFLLQLTPQKPQNKKIGLSQNFALFFVACSPRLMR
jgi:hypothetical protein